METLHGRIHNGVVVLEAGNYLPEGLEVTVLFPRAATNSADRPKRRVVLPLVKSNQPGTLHLTNEDIGRYLEEDDVSS